MSRRRSALAAPTRPTGRSRSNAPLLEEILDLARWAPNHNLTNPWRLRVIGPQALERLKEAAGPESAKKLDRAPTLVVVSCVLTGDPIQDEEDLHATACAAYIVSAGRSQPRAGDLLAYSGGAADSGGPGGCRHAR